MELNLNTRKKQMTENTNRSSEVFASCSFASLGLHPTLCDQLKERLGFEAPTLVQAQAIPVILSGRHVLVNAATGTGKTVAYLTPVIHQLQKCDPRIQRSDGTFALVLVPTHELCMQVYEILQKLLHCFHWIVPGYIMGGESRSKEKARLRKGICILVATPGRLLDHLKNTSSFLYTNLRWIIFDEADRILELGYGKEIEDILNILGSKQQKSVGKGNSSQVSGVQRQNLLLSATLNEKVNHLAEISLDNPVTVGIDEKIELQLTHEDAEPMEFNGCDILVKDGKPLNSSAEEYKLPTQLLQRYMKVPCGSRLVVLLAILKHLFENESSQKVVVFFSTCDAVDFHYSLVSGFQWLSHLQSDIDLKQLFLKCKTFRLHGNMNHEDRRTTFHAFKKEKSALLLSTDVAARGLDFPKVRCIIQYDPPGEATEYVHRVGRTARIGEKGDSLLFLQPVETDYLHGLEKHGVTLTEYPLQKLLDSFPLFGIRYHPKNFVSVDTHPWVVSLQKALESFTSSELKMKKMAQNAFCSWVRAYTAHRGELKGIFMVKKLHLGHVARSFALKEQPSLVNKSLQKQRKKRMRDQKQNNVSKKRKVAKR
ncbi:DEAD-box ATP-dependent RNA helicase 17 [Capsicum annuum]|uniref:ATP-dependent RNA helicase n=2 Tax=Capsicum TaxID=4071 RepID=A0A1U8HA31_CAPAN|nr:DEAD-box ATP-dependent RNA helicase 17 isoform X1 [Capsicum annuum]KAF3682096.1 DEAD-box ATP-dependent RNA helicase 17 [Capsicum annuum]KAF3684450.1 DEAD-box ATP-dependent RNA helicase 17 [Capsicum annuum]PHT76118.1 DEAD-box ATP-dependent RNA helicase 17 [Capsicum annuum]